MPNDDYAFGLDLYSGNSVRDWTVLDGWSKRPRFAYFGAGIGLRKRSLELMLQCLNQTDWLTGLYYELWLPEVPKAEQLATYQAQANLLGVAGMTKLPPAIAFELMTSEDRHGNKVEEFPSVGDLQYMLTNIPGAIVYTNEDGLHHIKDALGRIPSEWRFWLTFYGKPTVEGLVEAGLARYATYGIERERILFMQTTDTGVYPAGASYDKGADYDRAISFQIDAPAPVPVPEATAVSLVVTAERGLNIRSSPDTTSDANIVGNLKKGDTVFVEKASDHWARLAGFVSLDWLGTIPNQTPTPDVPPPAPAPAGTFYRILHDEEMEPEYLPRMLRRGSNMNTSLGIPETVNLENSLPVVLDAELQKFIYDQLRFAAPDLPEADVKHAFRALLGAHEAWANQTGFATKPNDAVHADYVNNRDVDASDPRLDRARNSGGNVVLVLDETPVHVGGVDCLKVATLNSMAPLPSVQQVNYKTTPWLVFRCTTVTPFEFQGSTWPLIYRCNRFPQLGGRDVPMVMITRTGYGFIEKARLVKVENPFVVRPYVP